MTDTLNRVTDWKERGFYMKTPPLTILSYDPAADGNDNDAVVLLSREEHSRGEPHDPDFAVQTMFRIVGACYMKPEYEFPDKLAAVLRTHRDMQAWVSTGRSAGSLIVVEANGIGYGMAASLSSKVKDRVLAYTTVGTTTSKAYGENGLIMPRLPGLSHLKMMLETHYVRAAKGAPGIRQLEQEFNTFVWAGPKRPEALPGQKDDMVMATAGGVWIGSKVIGPLLRAQSYGRGAS